MFSTDLLREAVAPANYSYDLERRPAVMSTAADLRGRLASPDFIAKPRGLPIREVMWETLRLTAGQTFTHPRYNPAIGVVEGLATIAGVSAVPYLAKVAPKTVAAGLFGDETDYGVLLGNRLDTCIGELCVDRHSRRAVAFVGTNEDIGIDNPCISMLQFVIRDEMLHVTVSLRSQDASLGLPHDVVVWTLVAQAMARCLQAKIGNTWMRYTSLHVYESDYEYWNANFTDGDGKIGLADYLPKDWIGIKRWAEAALKKTPWAASADKTSWERRPNGITYQFNSD